MRKQPVRLSNLQDLKTVLTKPAATPQAKPTPALTAPKLEVKPPDRLSVAEIFRRQMEEEGVRPIQREPPPPRRSRMTVRPPENPFEEIFITGQWEWTHDLQTEHIEAKHPSVSDTTLKKLRRGHFSVRAECDLHGLTQAEARDEVIRFVEEAARRRVGCIRIVHGKGNNSWEKVPVLKSRLQEWLFSRRLGRWVLAYSSARPCDGGTGAIYVLLRKA